ncbi:Maltose-binding protein MalE [Marinitoga hydrogenitolerans DSM 16785]|uniref:Maltose-binding protein MalE n=1 Tax=Marinitoga hydrogenitolerans (strain DSM 16785 / JCM 12826 / AT1271) TaxID=1122195 RepID=A0A1M4ZPM3_MARH1|nr:extracellular solute-binding protein [Marinitoga hydrogenitolerans]SHF19941.1 Maltose-binding protein MalE [Marinitoga hydrogenitolerans DSM 16785]
MKLKIIIPLLIIILILSYFFLPRKTITIVTQMSEDEKNGLEKIMKLYSLTHFVKFNIERIPFSGHFSRIDEIINSGQKIDIARVDIKTPKWFEEKYIKTHPILQSVDCLVMLYNKKEVQPPPKTLNELWAFIEENTYDINGNNFKSSKFDKNKINEYAIYLPYNSGWWMSTIFGSEDENFLTVNVNKERFIYTAKKIKHLYKNHLIPKISNNFYDEMMKMFEQNEVKIIFNGPWSFSSIQKSNIDFGISLIPKGKDTSFSPIGGQQWILLNNSKTAEKVFKYLSTDKVADLFYKYNKTIMPKEKLLNTLQKNNNIVAAQLKLATKIDERLNNILFKFFSKIFVDYLNDKIDENVLFNYWTNLIKEN